MYMYVCSFPANDKACVLNELGRMFLTFGDRSSACRYFRQAALTARPDEQKNHSLKEQNVCITNIAACLTKLKVVRLLHF